MSDMVAINDEAEDKLHGMGAQEWASCIAGAITVGKYRELLQKAGFQDITCFDESPVLEETCCSKENLVKSVAWLAEKPR